MANYESNKPTHDVCHVRGQGKRSYWTRIGAAWIHEDQQGMNLSLDYLPRDPEARIVIRVRKEKTEAEPEAQTEVQGEAA